MIFFDQRAHAVAFTLRASEKILRMSPEFPIVGKSSVAVPSQRSHGEFKLKNPGSVRAARLKVPSSHVR
jgi:hypothetical protein